MTEEKRNNPEIVSSSFISSNHLKTDFSPQDIFPKNNEAGKAIDDPDVLNPDLVFPLSVNYDYKYNGKEWQDEFGLNMYDMDMRMYDPAIARWVVMDPVIHHSMSPYNAFDNNPIFWADSSGADGENTSTDSSSTGITMMGIPLESMGVARIEVYGLGDGSQFNKSSNSNKNNSTAKDLARSGSGIDDIRFRDKEGNLIATFETATIDEDVYLPFTMPKGGDTNININTLLRLAGVDLEDIDVVGVGGTWDFTFGMGGGKGIEYVYFLDGENKGTWQSFIVERGNVGLNGSLGAYAIVGDYYNDKALTTSDYAGTSFSLNVGIKGAWIGSYGKFWAPKDISSDKLDLKSGFNTSLRSWTGYTVGGGAGAGAQWSKQNTTIYNP